MNKRGLASNEYDATCQFTGGCFATSNFKPSRCLRYAKVSYDDHVPYLWSGVYMREGDNIMGDNKIWVCTECHIKQLLLMLKEGML